MKPMTIAIASAPIISGQRRRRSKPCRRAGGGGAKVVAGAAALIGASDESGGLIGYLGPDGRRLVAAVQIRTIPRPRQSGAPRDPTCKLGETAGRRLGLDLPTSMRQMITCHRSNAGCSSFWPRPQPAARL